ncbi:arsenite efflux transporter metallochaperone ArsD [Pengzhenrongella sicca]|uniref:Arsenite efflux transporter metallochaperone ArsD n=1 Tax=Pengzhenrongella sicca TaxID=2819238 RepID=A0A8A4Z8G6_9MICO|nr:arsenite efflux transporter metallochaperone ArsD [Pengzhenrongella sicca]QTE28210.1 arsenite efflux transporter metallochaperone ArsD [Pengzhenrongella sicca]
MVTVEVFDPAMCCTTGVCGTDVDPVLARFAADLDWLAAQGVAIERATLAQEPGKFVANELVRAALDAVGTAALPAVVVDGALKSTGAYPARDQLSAWAGVAPVTTLAGLPAAMSALPMAGGCCGGGSC